jgi:hypothetical protein
MGKSEIFGASNRLDMNEIDVTPDNSISYFINENLSLHPNAVYCRTDGRRSKVSGAITLGRDNPMEFVCGETF